MSSFKRYSILTLGEMEIDSYCKYLIFSLASPIYLKENVSDLRIE